MEAVKVRHRARVSGRVQGVCYRASCRERAVALGLSGWVRNRSDGTVELEAEGSAEAIDALLEWCHEGPPGARVDAVESEPIAATGEPAFRIVR
jgi:acylphosphatase